MQSPLICVYEPNFLHQQQYLLTSQSHIIMRALRYYGIQDIRLDDIPEPDCRSGCVKLKPGYVGICGSDMCVSPLNPPVMLNCGTNDALLSIIPPRMP